MSFRRTKKESQIGFSTVRLALGGCRFRPAFKRKIVPYFVPYELQHMVHMVQLDTYSL
jgi:hypothetical protein